MPRKKTKASTFGQRLRQLRKDHGMTQVELAGKAGISQAMVVYLETGENEPGWQTVQDLADALDVSTEDFRR